MKRSKRIIQFLALAPVFIIPGLVLVLAVLVLNAEEQNYQRSLQQIEVDYIETEKSRIRSKVNNLVDLIHYRHSIINRKLHHRIERRVEDARAVALALYEKYHASMAEDELKQVIVEALRPLQWNRGESYIWIIDFQGVLQLGPAYLSDQEGESVIHIQDGSGRHIIEEEISIAKNLGQGFLWDSFTKPGMSPSKYYKQLAFVKNLGIYDWYIGSAEFMDTATKFANTQLLEAISQISKGSSDYIFAMDRDGNLLLNSARPDIVGRNMSETSDKDLIALYESILAAASSPEEEFIDYHWLNPATGLVDKKLSYVKAVEDSPWVIGSGFYPKVFEQGYEVQKQRLTTLHLQKMEYLQSLLLIGLTGAFVLSLIMSFMFYRLFNNYQKEVIEDNNHLRNLNFELEQQQITLSNELKEAEKALREEKTVDSLTQLPNKKYLLNRLQQELNRSNRYQSDLSVLVIQLANFNEVKGQCHQEDINEMLMELASKLKSLVRNVDLLGRVGPDEFMVVMPEVQLEEAQKMKQRIGQTVAQSENCLNVALNIETTAIAYEPKGSLGDFLKQVDNALLENYENNPSKGRNWSQS